MSKGICKEENCDRVVYALGWCRSHWKKDWDRRGGRITKTEAWPVYEQLVNYYGSKSKVAGALGISRSHFMRDDTRYVSPKIHKKAVKLLEKVNKNIDEGKLPNDSQQYNLPLEVVEIAQLSNVLRKWVVDYLAERPTATEFNFTGPVQALAFRAGKSVRVVSGYINNTTGKQFLSASVAEELLMAIDEDLALYDGRVKVIPNPTLSQEEWAKRMRRRGCYDGD